MDFPITFVQRNLLWNVRREVWAAYRLPSWHYDHLGHEQRLSLLWRLSRLFWNLQDYEGQLLVVPRYFGIREHYQKLTDRLNGPLADVGRQYCSDAVSYLEQRFGLEGVDFEVFLLLKLPRPDGPPPDLRVWIKSLWQPPRRFLEEWAGLTPFYVLDHEMTAWREREEMAFQRLGAVLRCQRASSGDLQRLLRRPFFRGLGEPALREGWSPGAKRTYQAGQNRLLPDRTAMLALAEGEMDLSNPRRIGITQVVGGREVTAFQACLCLSEFPDELSFPGCEWLYSLQNMAFPVEVGIRWSSQDHREAIGAVRRKKLEIADQDLHTRKAGEEVPLALLDAHDQALLLEHDLKQRKFPTVLATVTTCVAAADPQQLLERVRQVRDHFSGFQIAAELPAGDQMRLFTELLPGAPTQARDYLLRLPPEVLASSLFLATKSLGDHEGPVIGWTGALDKPVYLDSALAPRINRPASMAFIGSLGSGKSFTANLLTYLTVVCGGARALILDPKGERSGWLDSLPELRDQINLITLGPRTTPGILDPFNLTRNASPDFAAEAANLAVSLLSYLAGARPGDSRFLAIVQAVEEVTAAGNPSLRGVVRHLQQTADRPELTDLACYLRSISNLTYAHLLFGEGAEPAPDVTRPINILQLQNINLPSPAKAHPDYTLEEVLAVALMHAVTAFATAYTAGDRGVFKIVLLDEAWSLLGSSQGKALITRLLRTGRAMNNAVFLITQNVRDLLDETVRGQIGVKFLFRSEDQEEIARGLEFLGLERNDDNLGLLRGLSSGTCVMQDLEGRVGTVRIDPIYQHLLEAFDTRPAQIGSGSRR